MSKDDRSLEGWMDVINRLGDSNRKQVKDEEDAFFSRNSPLKEFSLTSDDGESVNYRVYKWDETDFAIFYQLPNGNYSLRHKLFYDKRIVKELIGLE